MSKYKLLKCLFPDRSISWLIYFQHIGQNLKWKCPKWNEIIWRMWLINLIGGGLARIHSDTCCFKKHFVTSMTTLYVCMYVCVCVCVCVRYVHLFSIKNIHINMVKEVYISYPCITREYGGYNMYPPLLLGRARTNTCTLTYTFIKTLKFKKIKL